MKKFIEKFIVYLAMWTTVFVGNTIYFATSQESKAKKERIEMAEATIKSVFENYKCVGKYYPEINVYWWSGTPECRGISVGYSASVIK